MKTGDKILLVILVILTVIVISINMSEARNTNKTVVIRSDGKIVKEIPLNKNESKKIQIKSKEGHLTVEINNGEVRVLDSTCKDKLCVKEGWIRKIGESIVCLPNRISISIIGRRKTEIDTTTY